MKSNTKKWLCGMLALLLALPAFAYNQEAQKQLGAEIANLLRQGKTQQVRAVLNAIPKCPAEDTVYESKAKVPTRCAGNGDVVNVKVKHPTKSGWFMPKTIPVVDVNIEERKQTLNRYWEWQKLSNAEKALAYKLLGLLQQQRYDEMKQVWESILLCKNVKANAKLPAVCKGDKAVTLTVSLPGDSRYQKNVTIPNIREEEIWHAIGWADLYVSTGENVAEFHHKPEYFKKYENTWFYPAIARFLWRGTTYILYHGDYDWRTGRSLYYWMEWGINNGMTPYEIIAKSNLYEDYHHARELHGVYGNIKTIMGEAWSEAVKHNQSAPFYALKQALFHRFVTDRTVCWTLYKEHIWDTLAIQMPADKKSEMQRSIERYIKEDMNPSSWNDDGERCEVVRKKAKQYGYWSDEAEEEFQRKYSTWIKIELIKERFTRELDRRLSL